MTFFGYFVEYPRWRRSCHVATFDQRVRQFSRKSLDAFGSNRRSLQQCPSNKANQWPANSIWRTKRSFNFLVIFAWKFFFFPNLHQRSSHVSSAPSWKRFQSARHQTNTFRRNGSTKSFQELAQRSARIQTGFFLRIERRRRELFPWTQVTRRSIGVGVFEGTSKLACLENIV